MCSRAGLLVAHDKNKRLILVSRADCDSWNCDECAERMKSNWVARARWGYSQFVTEGLSVDFVTITSHEKLDNFAQTEYVWRSAWSTLYAALKRKSKRLEYMVIPERHKDGRMHVHALWTANVSERWLKDNARKRGLGYKATISRVDNVSKAASYVTKYIGKDLGKDAPKHFRRVRVSRNFPAIPLPQTGLSAYEWFYIGGNGALKTEYEYAEKNGLTMIDVITGDVWDDIDLHTVVWKS
jgi:hypothetical protein